MAKERVDILLVKQGFYDSREKAKRSIMAGEVYDKNGERLDKPGIKIDINEKLKVKSKIKKYVSRGGFKLEKALDVFNICLNNKIVLDIGASTGGFTDVALQKNAQLVYALDVGYNQLDWKIRNDKRVIVMEHKNFRYSKLSDFIYGQPEFAMTDVSFISLHLILPVLSHILKPGNKAVMLVKPQFEAGPQNVGKNGIVRDPKVHLMVLNDIIRFSLEIGYNVLGLDFSPIKGGKGNIEFLLYLQLINSNEKSYISPQININDVIKHAYLNLNKG